MQIKSLCRRLEWLKYTVRISILPLVLAFFSQFALGEDMSRADYDDYLRLFNGNDPAFIKYYHPDVVLELNGSEIRGSEGIRDFYANVKKYIREKVEVTAFIRDGNQLAVEIPTTFEVIADWEDSFWGKPLKKGQVMRIVSWGIYDIELRCSIS